MESLIEKAEGMRLEDEVQEEVVAEIDPVPKVSDAKVEPGSVEPETVPPITDTPLKTDPKPVSKAEETKRQSKEFYACIEDDPYLKQHEHDLNTRLQKFKR